MKLFRFFRAAKTDDHTVMRETACVDDIRGMIKSLQNDAQYICCGDNAIAFSGTSKQPKLLLEISTQKSSGQKYLYASVDDEASWQEWDYDTYDEFVSDIARYIAARIGRTVKTVTEVSRSRFRIASYCLEADGSWAVLEDESTDNRLVCFVASLFSKSGEVIDTYPPVE